MKKKIKDLTIYEYKKCCDTYKCDDCPLFDKEKLDCRVSAYLFSQEYGEEEIEVEDEKISRSV